MILEWLASVGGVIGFDGRRVEGLAHFVFGTAECASCGKGPGEGVGTATPHVFRFGQTADGGGGEDGGPGGRELGDERRLGTLLVVGERRKIEGERFLGERLRALPLIRYGEDDGATEELQERLGGGQAGLTGGDTDAGGEAADRAFHRGREHTDFIEGEHPGVAREVEQFVDSGWSLQDGRGGRVDQCVQEAQRHGLARADRALDGEDGNRAVHAKRGEEPRLRTEPIGVGGRINEGTEFVECAGAFGFGEIDGRAGDQEVGFVGGDDFPVISSDVDVTTFLIGEVEIDLGGAGVEVVAGADAAEDHALAQGVGTGLGFEVGYDRAELGLSGQMVVAVVELGEEPVAEVEGADRETIAASGEEGEAEEGLPLAAAVRGAMIDDGEVFLRYCI